MMKRKTFYHPVTLFVLLLALLLIIGYTYVKDPSIWPVNSVQIDTQLQYVCPNDVQATVLPHVQGSFFTVNMRALQRDLNALPWVVQANIERVWPDTLKISLQEQQPLVRWNETAFINIQGELFDPGIPAADELPHLKGPAARSSEVLGVFQQLNAELTQIDMTVSELTLSDRGAWTATLNNSMVLDLGQEQIESRIARFVKAVEQLDLDDPSATYVDLRYTNGFVMGSTR